MKKKDFLKAKQGREHTKAAGAIPRTKKYTWKDCRKQAQQAKISYHKPLRAVIISEKQQMTNKNHKAGTEMQQDETVATTTTTKKKTITTTLGNRLQTSKNTTNKLKTIQANPLHNVSETK